MSVQIIRQDTSSVLTAQATIRENQLQPTTITALPIEDGSTVSDHAQRGQLTYTADLFFSDANGQDGAVADATAFLDYRVLSGVLCDINTVKDGILENMLLASSTWVTDVNQGRRFTTVWRQVRIGETGFTTLTPLRSTVPGQQDIGAQGTSEPDPEQAAQDRNQIRRSEVIRFLQTVGAVN